MLFLRRFPVVLPLVFDFFLSLSSAILSTATGRSTRDPSGVTFREGSSLRSSCLGVVGVKCPLIFEYCCSTSSPGSPQIHSLCLNDGASSNAAKLGVIGEVVSCVEIKLGCCSI